MHCWTLIIFAAVVSGVFGAPFQLDCGIYGKTFVFDDEDLGTSRCPQAIKPVYKLYTRANRQTPQDVTRTHVPNVFKGRRNTIFIVHGYISDHTKGWMALMKNALLNRADLNVIIVGWGGGSHTWYYPDAAADTFGVGLGIRAIAKKLISTGTTKSKLSCVGHSLGAHTCGHAGRLLAKFGRVTGLDPAGPLWEGYHRGLMKSAATFVDTMSTHGKGDAYFGTLDMLGHAGFYPNGGGFQPGCWTRRYNNIMLKTEPYEAACSHGRAHKYFTESVKRDCFIARHKCTDKNKVNDKCPRVSATVMGYGASSSKTGLFYVPVGSTPPFCKN